MALTVQPIQTGNITTVGGQPNANAAGTIYAGGKATQLANKNAFYNYIAANKGLGAQQFYNNPWGVSAQEINGLFANPSAPTGPTNTAALSGGGLSPADIAAYDQSIGQTNDAINRLGAQQASGNTAIDQSLGTALAQLLAGKTAANQTYNTNVTADKSSYIQGKNTIGAQAGSTLNGLLRLLGSRGAGGGSAYNTVAPGVVAQQATAQRNGLSNTFGANERALDQNWQTYLQGYGDQVANANTSAQQKKIDLQNSIDTNRASLLQSLAQLQTAKGNQSAAQPYLNQANQLLDKTANYTTLPIQVTQPTYTAPSAASYTVNPNAAPTSQGQGAANDYTSPYLAALLGKGKQTAAAVGA